MSQTPRLGSLTLIALLLACAGPNERARVSAAVLAVGESRESIPYAIVTVRFENNGSQPLRIAKYEIVWPGGRHEGEGPRSLAPGESRSWRVQLPVVLGGADRAGLRVTVLDARRSG